MSGSMNEWQFKVLQFMKAMPTCRKRIAQEPKMLSEDAFNFRVDFMKEELDEFIDAYQDEDFVGMSDAIVDLLYVVIGTGIEMGLELSPLFDEVHRSNMTKTNGRARADGKWLKPEDWDPPNLEPIIKRMKNTNRII